MYKYINKYLYKTFWLKINKYILNSIDFEKIIESQPVVWDIKEII